MTILQPRSTKTAVKTPMKTYRNPFSNKLQVFVVVSKKNCMYLGPSKQRPRKQGSKTQKAKILINLCYIIFDINVIIYSRL